LRQDLVSRLLFRRVRLIFLLEFPCYEVGTAASVASGGGNR
jgi:hypothetical protein